MTHPNAFAKHPDARLRMVYVRHAWALEYRRANDLKRSADNFAEAHQRLYEAMEAMSDGKSAH